MLAEENIMPSPYHLPERIITGLFMILGCAIVFALCHGIRFIMSLFGR